MVKTYVAPDFTAQTPPVYKDAIDSSMSVLAEVAKQFAPREMTPVGMGITVEAGSLMDGTAIAAANVAGIGAPAANPRIDRVYLNLKTNTFDRVVGVEGAVPVAPAYPAMCVPIAAITLTVGMASILNANIVDERSFVQYVPVRIVGGYTELVDIANDEARIAIGKFGIDNRVFVRTHTNEGGSSFVVQADDFTNLLSIFGNGDVKAHFKFAANGETPQAKATLGAAATDLASVIALANAIRTALINNGIGQA